MWFLPSAPTNIRCDVVNNKRLCVWYSFSQFVPEFANTECIWSREKTFTWQQAHDRAVQWAQFFLANGVKPGDLVATYLMNSADFLTIWLGLLCIGCAPAHINYNLKGESLVHCLRVAGVKLVLVDSEPECAERFGVVREQVEKELGVTPFTVDAALLDNVYSGPVNVPGDVYRDKVTGSDPISLFYVSLFFSFLLVILPLFTWTGTDANLLGLRLALISKASPLGAPVVPAKDKRYNRISKGRQIHGQPVP